MFAELRPGEVFARDFRIVRPLAQGGMGAVFVALQLSTGSLRALKVMHPKLVTDAKNRERFVQEARVGALIKSDHVVEVVGAGVDETTGIAWLAMELLEGETLGQAIEARGAMRWDDIAQVFEQLRHALGAAHRLGLVHRDLKPDNLFLQLPHRSGIPFTVKVLDFGIAKYTGDPSVHGQTTAAIGSPMWMAPEQASPGPVAPTTDVWALGLIAFYVFTGKLYWKSANGQSATVSALISEILLGPLDAASARARTLGALAPLPTGFDGWFARCVHRDPSRRFQQGDDAAQRLLDVLRGVHDPSFALAETMAMAPSRPLVPLVFVSVVGFFALVGVASVAIAVVVARHRAVRAPLDADVTTQAYVSASSPSSVSSDAPIVAGVATNASPSVSPSVVKTASALPKITAPPAVTVFSASTPGNVDAAYAAYVQGQVTPLIQQCWTAAQKETANHPTEQLRLTIHLSDVTGRAYQVDAPGLGDRRLQWCIQAAIQRFQFRRPSLAVEVSMAITLTPD
jgi:serine/threonine protein kinase